MSASLPRIKTVRESTLATTESQKELKVKFRKLLLDVPDNGEDRKQTLNLIKTERLKSLSHYSTAQQQRDYKNQKIHLNLIERNLLSGTYDEKKETSNKLNVLKQKRDHMRVQMTMKQREINRVKLMLNDVRQEITEYMSRKGEYDEKLQEVQGRHEVQLGKAETARENRSVLESMIKARTEININLSKRNNELKERAASLANGMNLINTELRESIEHCVAQQSRLQQLSRQLVKQRQQRNQQIYKHQQRISRRREGEVQQVEKSKKYISQLDEVQRNIQLMQFHEVYDKILTGLLVRRFLQQRMIALEEKYEVYEHSYNSITSYHSFDTQEPKSLGVRFQQQGPENQKMEGERQEKEELIASLEARREQLRRNFQAVQIELNINEQKYSQSFASTVEGRQRAEIERVKGQAQDLQQRSVRVKTRVLRLLKQLNQKGDKKIYSGPQATINNLSQLTELLRESYRQLQ